MMPPKYRKYRDRIDVDAFERAIGFEPIRQKDDEDIGHCLDLWGLHKHGDRTGKFYLNREKKVYHCLVCGGGSLLSLAMEANNLDAREAEEWLSQFTSAGEPSEEVFREDIHRLLEGSPSRSRRTLPRFNDRLLLPWSGQEDPWFQARGIHPAVKRRFRLGVNPEARIKSARGVHQGRSIVIPHYFQGKLVGWQSRWLDAPAWVPKYESTPDFPKRESLFNYDSGGDDPPFIVESPTTALFLESQGFRAMATFGASLPEEQLKLLRGFPQGVILAPDNDEAGRRFTETAIEYLERFIPVKIVPPPEIRGGDLGDFSDNPDALREQIGRAYDSILEKHGTTQISTRRKGKGPRPRRA